MSVKRNQRPQLGKSGRIIAIVIAVLLIAGIFLLDGGPVLQGILGSAGALILYIVYTDARRG